MKQRPLIGLILGAMTMGSKKAATVLPEERPDLFAIRAGHWESIEIFVSGPTKGALLVVGR